MKDLEFDFARGYMSLLGVEEETELYKENVPALQDTNKEALPIAQGPSSDGILACEAVGAKDLQDQSTDNLPVAQGPSSDCMLPCKEVEEPGRHQMEARTGMEGLKPLQAQPEVLESAGATGKVKVLLNHDQALPLDSTKCRRCWKTSNMVKKQGKCKKKAFDLWFAKLWRANAKASVRA